MKDIILKYIEKGVTLKQLAELTGSSEKKVGSVLRMIENDGYLIDRSFDDRGNIIYQFLNIFDERKVAIANTSNSVKAIILSDLHIGSYNDGLNYIDKVFDYAVANDIHLFFVVGDLFDGYGGKGQSKYPKIEDQLHRFFKNYPYLSGILTFTLLGNHELFVCHDGHFDVSKRLSFRPDIINLGYGVGKVYLGNSLLVFRHELTLVKPDIACIKDAAVVFKGHSHKFEIHDNMIIVPSMLNDAFYDNIISMGFLDVTFHLNGEQYIKKLDINQLTFNKQLTLVNKITLPVPDLKK